MELMEQRQMASKPHVGTKRRRGRPRKETKLVRYSVLWLEPAIAEALTAECGTFKRTAVIRQMIVEGLRARGRLPDGNGNGSGTVRVEIPNPNAE
jgi:hypothetical protein